MTTLGNSAQTLKQGRYARLMGTLWRHEKTEKVGDAALGLFARILSFLADQAQETVSEKRMVELFRGNPNGRRQLNQLLAAGFMEAVPGGGYAPHDWSEHNRVTKPVKLRVVRSGPVMNMRGLCDDVVMNAPPEIIEEPCVPRARAETQDPEEREEKERTTPPPTAVPPRARAPRKARPKDPHKETFRRVLGEACRDGGVLLEGALSPTQLAAASKRAGEHAEREGIDYETASRKLCSDAVTAVREGRKSALCWALRDWQPNAAPPRPLYGRQKLEIAGCSPAHEFDSVEEAERKMAAREAEVARIRAAREEVRRVGT